MKKLNAIAGLALGAGLLAGGAMSNIAFAHNDGGGTHDETKPQGPHVVKVTIDGGYHPGKIKVHPGREVRLTFVRKEKQGCGDVVRFPGLKETKDGKEVVVERTLKSGEETTISFTPKEKGTLHFTSGMGMYKGSVVVK